MNESILLKESREEQYILADPESISRCQKQGNISRYVYSVCLLKKSISRSSFTRRMLHLMYKQVKSDSCLYWGFVLDV